MVLDTGRNDWVQAVTFHPDGKHVLGGNSDGIRRWRFIDGREVGKQTGMDLHAISVSRDHKWMVCGTSDGASVWDGEIRAKVIQVEGTHLAWAVDVSPDSTRFATGTVGFDSSASIWSITTGKRLVGPLRHNSYITGVQFSPDGERIATACEAKLIRIFDSHGSDNVITINTNVPSSLQPLAWSSDGHQIFAASQDKKIRTFDTSTGSQLAESQILQDGNRGITSIALATNGNFIATYTRDSIWFLGASTLARIGPVMIQDGGQVGSIAISANSSHLATGRHDGKIAIRDLGKILPDSYGPFHVSIYAPTLVACEVHCFLSPTLTNYSGIYS